MMCYVDIPIPHAIIVLYRSFHSAFTLTSSDSVHRDMDAAGSTFKPTKTLLGVCATKSRDENNGRKGLHFVWNSGCRVVVTISLASQMVELNSTCIGSSLLCLSREVQNGSI